MYVLWSREIRITIQNSVSLKIFCKSYFKNKNKNKNLALGFFIPIDPNLRSLTRYHKVVRLGVTDWTTTFWVQSEDLYDLGVVFSCVGLFKSMCFYVFVSVCMHAGVYAIWYEGRCFSDPQIPATSLKTPKRKEISMRIQLHLPILWLHPALFI